MKSTELVIREWVYLHSTVTIAPMKKPAVIRKKLNHLFVWAVALAFLSLFARVELVRAEAVTNLYNTVVPVANQSKSEQLRAMRVGLGKVLVKVTGDSQSLSSVSFANPERYITEFGYVSYRDPMAPEEEAPGIAMTLSFASSAVNRLLRQHQLQVWPSDRQGLLVWMVVDDPEEGKRFVTAENMPKAMRLLESLMEDRGAPLILPLLDLQDSQNISERDVWNLNSTRLDSAAGRYNASHWLALRFYQSSNGQWRAARLLRP